MNLGREGRVDFDAVSWPLVALGFDRIATTGWSLMIFIRLPTPDYITVFCGMTCLQKVLVVYTGLPALSFFAVEVRSFTKA